ncbi:MAG TPA: DoxX family protein [Ktedonobacterales bacterium]|nr:DoxX family protein [Ktedonobacterales bacterium]
MVISPQAVSAGLLILRVVGGLTLAGHGAQKLFGWFDGPGLTKFRQGMERQGLKPGAFWAGLGVLGEFGGGLSLAFGFLTPLGAAGVGGAMFMAIASAHWANGFWNSKRGIEFPLALLTIGAAIGVAGPGLYSLDALFGIHLPEITLFVILAVVAVVVDVVGLVLKRSAAARAPAPSATHAS